MTPAPFLDLAPGGRAPDECFWITAADGVRLRAARWRAPAATAHAAILTGRTEYLEKTAITAAAYVARGISVVSFDWRGQGLSDRMADDPLKGHVDTFDDYQLDLDAALAAAELTGPLILHGHSMGGTVAVGAIERQAGDGRIKVAVLTAPMFRIAMPRPMRAAAWATMQAGRALGLLDRWPPLGDMRTPYALSNPQQNVLTQDEEVWAWLGVMARDHPDVALAMPTIGWFNAAEREMRRVRSALGLPVPVLCVLGQDESVVDADQIRITAARIGAELVEVPDGRHEVLIESPPARAAAWQAIDDFLMRHGLAQGGAYAQT